MRRVADWNDLSFGLFLVVAGIVGWLAAADLPSGTLLRMGPGWMPHALTLADARAGIERIRHWQRESGRASAPLTAVVPLKDVFDPDGYRRAQDAGVTHVLTAPWLFYGGSHRSLADKRDGLRRFADTVIAKLR